MKNLAPDTQPIRMIDVLESRLSKCIELMIFEQGQNLGDQPDFTTLLALNIATKKEIKRLQLEVK